jgi:hypothetical protein
MHGAYDIKTPVHVLPLVSLTKPHSHITQQNKLQICRFNPLVTPKTPPQSERPCIIFRNMSIFYGEDFLNPRPIRKLENQPLSVVQVPTTQELASSIRNTRTHRRRGLWRHLITNHSAPSYMRLPTRINSTCGCNTANKNSITLLYCYTYGQDAIYGINPYPASVDNMASSYQC